MVSVVDEHLGVLIRLESWAVRVVSEEHLVELVSCDIASRVVDLGLVINIDAWSASVRRVVEDLAREWIVSGFGNIVVSEMDDVLASDAIIHQDLDGVMSVSLMTIVAVGV